MATASRVKRRISRITAPGGDYQIHIIGEHKAPLSDFYYALLRLPWWVTIATIAGVFLVANMLFALAFLLLTPDGIGGAGHGSFVDAFFFSVETMGTIGYGVLYPKSVGANLVMVVETITGLTLTALATGLVFAKFSRSTARLVFTDKAVITPINGTPTLVFRIGNARANQIVDARIRLVMVRTERGPSGDTFYRMLDLKLQRDHTLTLARSWSVLHTIDRDSPLHGATPQSLLADEVELQVLVVGLDDIFMQTVHAQHRYFTQQIVWGARLADVLSETPEGNLVLDLRKFHDLEATPPTESFPYPSSPARE